ncbi:hypothetical protein [Paludibaculum fermentans]|uniref:Uncharacterized protein n=1 Tax=Paludibaculum fermentans TaxID=1473598 RepID=A0A7S7SPN9_PALFE|nr:hypothetical protein [Paludibaculum fermentans]QOY91791.1 hypothetical protein IRI77_18165 [Paludibaculum fermentans]
MAENPLRGELLVAAAVVEPGIEKALLAFLVEDAMAVEHPPLVVKGAARGIDDGLGFPFGPAPEEGFDVGRHAVDAGIGPGAAAIGGDDGFAGDRARTGGFAGIGPVGGEALL